jgi:Zn-dependent protease with chaperone function
LRSEGAQSTSVASDPELTQMERVVMGVSTLGWGLAAVAMVGAWIGEELNGSLFASSAVILMASAVAQIAALRRWRKRAQIPR